MRVEVPEADLALGRLGDMADKRCLLYSRPPVGFAVVELFPETFGLWMVGSAVGPLNLALEKVQVLLPAPICSG